MDEFAKELPPPEDSERDGAVELLRAWVIDGMVNFQLRDGILEDPEEFGALLADLALETSFLFGETEEAATLAFERIMDGFGARLSDAGDDEDMEEPF